MLHWNSVFEKDSFKPVVLFSSDEICVNSNSNFIQTLSKPALFFIFTEALLWKIPYVSHCNPVPVFMHVRASNCTPFHRGLDCRWREHRMLTVYRPTQIRHFSLPHFLLLHLPPPFVPLQLLLCLDKAVLCTKGFLIICRRAYVWSLSNSAYLFSFITGMIRSAGWIFLLLNKTSFDWLLFSFHVMCKDSSENWQHRPDPPFVSSHLPRKAWNFNNEHCGLHLHRFYFIIVYLICVICLLLVGLNICICWVFGIQ